MERELRRTDRAWVFFFVVFFGFPRQVQGVDGSPSRTGRRL